MDKSTGLSKGMEDRDTGEKEIISNPPK